MTKSDKDPEDSFAHELERKYTEIVRGENPEERLKDLDPAVADVMPVLNLIEEVRRFQISSSQSLVETPLVGSTDGMGLAKLIDFDYDETQRVGRFEIHEQLGQGGFGVVFRATDTSLGREVAIKIPRFEASLSEDSRRRFTREAQAAAALNHPNIVGVYESGTEQGIDFIVCELVDGQDLAAHICSTSPLDAKSAAEMLVKLCYAVEHAHGRGVLHRDLKPSNVLLDEHLSCPRISDFGLASINDSKQNITQTGAALGTPAYMSPEQAAGTRRSLGPGTDIYGLGTILFYALCGKAPFDGHSTVETLTAVAKDEPPTFQSLGCRVPLDLEAICQKCLEKNSVHRYLSAKELGADLQRFLDGVPVAAKPVGHSERARRWAVRNPRIAIPLGAALVSLLAALLVTSSALVSSSQALRAKTDAERESRENYFQLKSAVDTYFKEIEEDPVLRSMPGAEPLRQRLLDRAREYYQQFIQQNEDQNVLGLELVDTELRIGRILDQNGNHRDALETFESAGERLSRLLSDGQREATAGKTKILQAQVAFQLAATLSTLGDMEVAKEYIDEAISHQRDILSEQESNFQAKEALAKSLRSACLINTRLRNPHVAIEQGSESVGLFEEMMHADETHGSRMDRLRAAGQLAGAYASVNELAKAEQTHLEIFETTQKMIEQEPNQWDANELLLLSALQSAPLAFARRDFESPLPRLLIAEKVAVRLIGLHPSNRAYVDYRLGVIKRLVACYEQSASSEKAHELSLEAVEISRLLANDDQSTFDNRLNLCGSIVNLLVLRSQHDLLTSASQNLLDEAALLAAECHAEQPTHEGAQLSLAHIHRCQAWLSELEGSMQKAVEQVDNGIAVVNELFATGAKHSRTISVAESLHIHRARLLESEMRFEEAIEDRKMQLYYSKLLKRPRDAQQSLALAHLRLNQADAAQELYNEVTGDEITDSRREWNARYFALLYKASDPPDEKWATKALELLEQLASHRYFHSKRHKQMLEHSDYDALKERMEFKNWLSQAIPEAEFQ